MQKECHASPEGGADIPQYTTDKDVLVFGLCFGHGVFYTIDERKVQKARNTHLSSRRRHPPIPREQRYYDFWAFNGNCGCGCCSLHCERWAVRFTFRRNEGLLYYCYVHILELLALSWIECTTGSKTMFSLSSLIGSSLLFFWYLQFPVISVTFWKGHAYHGECRYKIKKKVKRS